MQWHVEQERLASQAPSTSTQLRPPPKEINKIPILNIKPINIETSLVTLNFKQNVIDMNSKLDEVNVNFQKNFRSDWDYLEKSVGKALIKALDELASKRPEKPL